MATDAIHVLEQCRSRLNSENVAADQTFAIPRCMAQCCPPGKSKWGRVLGDVLLQPWISHQESWDLDAGHECTNLRQRELCEPCGVVGRNVDERTGQKLAAAMQYGVQTLCRGAEKKMLCAAQYGGR